MRLSLLIIFLFIGGVSVRAQDDFIVTIKGDTMRGKVKIMSYDAVDHIQVNVNKKKESFLATQVRVMFIDGAQFVAIRYDNTIRMMKVLKSGSMSLYAYRMPNQSSYDGRLLGKIGVPPQELPNISFRRLMTNYTEDCPAVSGKIKDGELGRQDIEKIIDSYNTCVTQATNERLAVAVDPTDPKITTIDDLQKKIEASSLESKKDVSELLKNIREKVVKKETIPSYMLDGLKSYLSTQPDFSGDLDHLLAVLK